MQDRINPSASTVDVFLEGRVLYGYRHYSCIEEQFPRSVENCRATSWYIESGLRTCTCGLLSETCVDKINSSSIRFGSDAIFCRM